MAEEQKNKSTKWTQEEDDLVTKLWIENNNSIEIHNYIPWRTLEGIRSRIKKLKLSEKYPHPSLIDLRGQKFGKLTVIDRFIDKSDSHTKWICNCDCGNKNIIVYGQSIKSGAQVSCGCSKRERMKQPKLIKGNKYDLTKEYGIGYTSNTGHEFYFDMEDYELIKKYTWREDLSNYIVSNSNGNANNPIFIHRLVMDVDDSDIKVDHIYHDTYDNRKKYLRKSTQAENIRNAIPKNKYGANGIYKDNKRETYYAYIVVDGERIYLGAYHNVEDAVKSRIEAEKLYYKEFAYKRKEEN